MSRFPDVEAFVRQHADCGGVTPNASAPIGGGYLLTLTCVCGAVFDRWVSPEEAALPLSASPPPVPPAPPPVPPPRPAPPPLVTPPSVLESEPAPRGPVPSPDLQEVLRQAIDAVDAEADEREPELETEAETIEPSLDVEEALRAALEAVTEPAPPRPPAPPPPASPAPSPPSAVLPGRPVPLGPPAPPPSPLKAWPPRKELAPSPDLKNALARAVGTVASPVGESPKPTPPPVRPPQTPTPAAAHARSSGSRWRSRAIVALVLAIMVMGAGWYVLSDQALLSPATPADTARTVSGPPAPPAPAGDDARAATAGMLLALRQVQAAATPTAPYTTYSSRVSFAKADLDRFARSSASATIKTAVQETVDIYALAGDAWRARSAGPKELFEAIGDNAAVDTCPSVKRVADLAEQGSAQTRAQARGIAVSNAVSLLWQCAADRLGALERSTSAQ
jgi:hypothetical protein